MNFIQQAYKGKNEWYHWVLTIVLIFFGWQILGAIPLVMAAAAKSENLSQFTEFAQNNFMTAGLNKNFLLFLMIFTFFTGLIFLCIGIKYIHKRTITSLITSRKKVDWKRFFYAFFVWGIIAIVMSYIGILLAPENYIWNFKASPFFILVAISFLFIPFQTSLEELLFRGYFMQGIGISTTSKKFPFYLLYILFSIVIIFFLNKIFNYDIMNMTIVSIAILLLLIFLNDSNLFLKIFNSEFNKLLNIFFNSRLTPLLITSVVFGLLHSANPEVAKLGQITMVFYIGTGLLYGIVTLMDEGTELALGLHAINNIVAAFFITTDWTVFQTDALYIDTSEPSVTWEMFIPVFVLYPLLLILFSKKYGWKNWKEKLAGKIVEPVNLKENYKILNDIETE
ncbi:CPBP family glutamic-type intramembrane protease [Polaribacter aestuariivivens]|uniref:CPBP family glutamic-type intramembrane protease n=1 Tax=Polaribacter aestuariivivens TaxID=2304626 RepID=UPI0014872489|nr:CPBP family glutamic-type intramembrane protease [Polaribacter aestuariivivens]